MKSSIGVVLVLFVVSACSRVPDGSTAVHGEAVSHPSRVAHARMPRSMRGGAWRVVAIDRDPYAVAVAVSKTDARVLFARPGTGYELRQVRVDCGRGDVMVVSAMKAATDASPATVGTQAYPGFDLRPIASAFCSGKGRLVLGDVPRTLAVLRTEVSAAVETEKRDFASHGGGIARMAATRHDVPR